MHSNLGLNLEDICFSEKREGYVGLMHIQKNGLIIITYLSAVAGMPVQTVNHCLFLSLTLLQNDYRQKKLKSYSKSVEANGKWPEIKTKK